MIDPADWNLTFCRKVFNTRLPDDFKISWKSYLTGTGTLPGQPGSVTLAQGLSAGKHTLTLSGLSGGGVGAFTVYRPPFPRTNP